MARCCLLLFFLRFLASLIPFFTRHDGALFFIHPFFRLRAPPSPRAARSPVPSALCLFAIMLATVASRRIAASASRWSLAASSAAARCSIAPSVSAVHPGQYRHMSSDLPYHIVVGMPALSPTMESGTIAEWNVKEGDAFAAGDSVAEIETDKATIAFEVSDEVIARKTRCVVHECSANLLWTRWVIVLLLLL